MLGDLLLDVVIQPERRPARSTDVPGHVAFRQGGSAATTARWLARLGAVSTLICAIGRDGPGRALVTALQEDGVLVRAVRFNRRRTGRIGVLVDADGERSFVADRGAADALRPGDLRGSWFARAQVLHLPAYSLVAGSLGLAGLDAVRLARKAGAVISLDLASSGPLLSMGAPQMEGILRETAPDLLFASAPEADAVLEGRPLDELLRIAPIAIVKRGPEGATILARDGRARLRFEVATRALEVGDTTGAGDAFDAGFIVAWLRGRAGSESLDATLRRAALAGHAAAARHLSGARPELTLG